MKLVHFDAPIGKYRAGDMLAVAVTRVGAWSLQGQPALGSLAGPAGPGELAGPAGQDIVR